VFAIADESSEEGLALRYRVDTTDTGYGGRECEFTISSFWLVTSLAMIETDRARTWCHKLLSVASLLHRHAEIGPSTGEHVDNLPQAFTHHSLIDAVTRLIDAEAAAS
jgi:alpha,alpha-trehalase